MPRTKISLTRWDAESQYNISASVELLLDMFEHMKVLYPEVAKYDNMGVFDFAQNVQDFWIVKLNVYGFDPGNAPPFPGDEWDETEGSFGRGGASGVGGDGGGGGGGGGGSGLGILLNFPDPSLTLEQSEERSDNPEDESNHLSLDDILHSPSDEVPLENTPSLGFKDLPSLSEEDDPLDKAFEDHIRTRIVMRGIPEQHVVGLAFAIPSSLCASNEYKSCDVGVFLDFNYVRERLFDLGLAVLPEEEEQFTRDALIRLLLGVERKIGQDVLQFQSTISPLADWIHDRVVEVFTKLKFFKQEEKLKYRGFDEVVTILSLGRTQWQTYRTTVLKVPGKGKGKGKANPINNSKILLG